MRSRAEKIDEKIDHYRALLSHVTDQLASEGIAQLIADLLAEKVALHPEQDE
jgi:hypothetical protein